MAVRRGVADVDWIQQVQSIVGTASLDVGPTTQAKLAMAIGRGSVIIGEAYQIGRAMAVVGGGNDSTAAYVVSTVLSMTHRVGSSMPWLGDVRGWLGRHHKVAAAGQAREGAVDEETKEEQTRKRT